MRFPMDLFSWMKNRKKLKLNKDYSFIDSKPFIHFKILKGKYKGVVYHYGRLYILPIENEEENHCLKFDLVIVDSGKFERKTLENDQNFVELVGNILTQIVIEQAEREPYESNRENNTEEFDL